MPKRQNIKNFTRKKLREWLEKKTKSYKKNQIFRADQIFFWLYKKRVKSFAEMKNLGKEIQELLEKNFFISSILKIEAIFSYAEIEEHCTGNPAKGLEKILLLLIRINQIRN